MAGLQVGQAKVRLRTATVKAELEGPITACAVDLLRFVRDRAAREKVLERMREVHADMCEREDEKARQAAPLVTP